MAEQTTTAPAPPAVQVRLSADKLQVLVTVADPHGNLPLAASRVFMELASLELADEPEHEAVMGLLAEACAPGESLVEHPLLEGTPAVPCRDAEVEWARDFFASGFQQDCESGQVDYWRRAENRALLEGELIATLLLPLEGTPGLDLQGNEIPVGKPRPARLRAGKGVRTEETTDRILYYADIAGRLMQKDGNISVENVYSIKGDVCLATGNIVHTGTVVVGGDVREGARLEVQGDLYIKGMVEPADIVCGGDLTVGGGILGNSEHQIMVEGAVQARYLNEVVLRCGGDLTVTSEIDHSDVACAGQIDMPRGRIAGGRVRLYRGGRIGHAGASGSTGTEIVLGTDWRYEAVQVERRQRLARLQEAREKLSAAIAGAAQFGTLDPARRDAVAKLQAKLAQVDAALQAESEAQNQAAQESIAGAVRELGILLTTFPGVTFRIGANAVTSDREYDMPRLIALRRDKVRILPMGELNQPA
ncbi:MAG: FapA family protein [Candidatus Krumholzibacteriia bacterium]